MHSMTPIYVALVKKGLYTIDKVPTFLQEEVRQELAKEGIVV